MENKNRWTLQITETSVQTTDLAVLFLNVGNFIIHSYVSEEIKFINVQKNQSRRKT